MTISISIPTLDRQERLRHLLASILANTLLPDEVVVVEQGNLATTQAVLDTFRSSGVSLRAVAQEEKSVAVARNRGAKETTGDLLVFLDDDMEIARDYIEKAAAHFDARPETLGAMGTYVRGEPAWTLKRFIGVLFMVYSARARNVVLPSGSYDYIRGRHLEDEQSVEWLSGGNMILRRSLFDQGYQFEEHFKRWAFGEDVLFSYRIHKDHPGSLRYLPELSVRHLEGTEHKLLNTEVLRMRIIYRFIFWEREVWNQNPWNVVAYLWSQIGLSGLELMQHPSGKTFITLVRAYAYLLKNHAAISSGTIDYNRFVFDRAS